MKSKDIVWFESEIDRIVHTVGQYNENHLDCQLDQCDLESSLTYRRLLGACNGSSGFSFRFFLILLVLSLGLAHWSSVFTLLKPGSDPDCLVKLPDSLQNAFVPPNRCHFCQNLTTIDRVEHLSPENFTTKYAYSKVPVVVTDATINWTAMQMFSFEYFKQIYTEKDFGRKKNCQFFPYKTEFHSLREVFRMDPSRAKYISGSMPWYIGWSNCDYSITNKLRGHYRKPYFLPNDSEPIRTDWIFMGTPNNGAHMHIDHVGRPSWQAQIRGTKRWFLEPPLECYAECNDHTVDVSPGDIIVLDTNVWYHKTLIVGDQVSITIGAEYD